MIVEKWHKFLYVKSYGWFVGERVEGDSVVEEYELDGIRYDLFFEHKRFTWTTPAGEVRPCKEKTRVLVNLVEMPA